MRPHTPAAKAHPRAGGPAPAKKAAPKKVAAKKAPAKKAPAKKAAAKKAPAKKAAAKKAAAKKAAPKKAASTRSTHPLIERLLDSRRAHGDRPPTPGRRLVRRGLAPSPDRGAGRHR